MKIKTLLPFICFALLFSCKAGTGETPSDTDKEKKVIPFAKGADISWVTEMESRGYKFYNAAGQERECTALMAELGCNMIRLRVWVDPEDGWCGKEDVLAKAKRAKALGMRIMIDFHYSDWWADPGKQNVPAAWKGYDVRQMAAAVADHTREVLGYLKDNGIEVTWVQVGNEVENGMLWESGRVKGSEAGNFASYFNAGAQAVKEVYPDAIVVLHISNAWKNDTLVWFYDLMKTAGVNYDMIGLSLYPSYWEGGAYPDWQPKAKASVANFQLLHVNYGKPVMLVEFGMPASQPEASAACLQYLMDGVAGFDWFKGIILWEPESEHSGNGYDYGAFKDGKPTEAMAPFK